MFAGVDSRNSCPALAYAQRIQNSAFLAGEQPGEEQVLTVTDISISFGGLKALDNVNVHVEQGTVCSLIGPNGAGKTTLFNVITGVLRAGSGTVKFLNRDITRLRPYQICRKGIAKTYQLRNSFPNLTVFENIRSGFLKDDIGSRKREMLAHEILEKMSLSSLANEKAANLPPLDSKLLDLGRALATSPKTDSSRRTDRRTSACRDRPYIRYYSEFARSGLYDFSDRP